MRKEMCCIRNDDSEVVSPLYETIGELATWAAENREFVDRLDDTFYVAYGTLDDWNYFDIHDYSDLDTLKSRAKELIGEAKPETPTKQEVTTMMYIAYVYNKDTKKDEIIKSNYHTKANFAKDLRANGYAVKFISTADKFDADSEKYHSQLETKRLVAKLNRESAKRIMSR